MMRQSTSFGIITLFIIIIIIILIFYICNGFRGGNRKLLSITHTMMRKVLSHKARLHIYNVVY